MHKLMLLLYTLEAAGAEKVVLSLVDGIDRRRYSPVVCAFRGGRLRQSFEDLGIPVYVLNKKRGPDLVALWRLIRLMRQHRISILHSHNFSANLWGRVAAVVARVPVRIATEHSMPSIKTRLERNIDQTLARLTTKIVSVSAAVRDAHVRDEKIDPDKFAVIYNGIKPWTWSEAHRLGFEREFRQMHAVPKGAPLCITVGRLEQPKGHETLLSAVPAILRDVPDARFLFAGDGSLQAQLEAQADVLQIRDRVIFLGARTDVRQLLAICNVAIMPSHREGFSIAILEAMAAGLPIVATNVGGNAEAIISGESGVVVPPGDPEVLAVAVKRLLTDQVQATALGQMARIRFDERFTIDRMIRLHDSLYTGPLGARN
jgi:glycosyltransferase involved in cell wall biosynthesis